MKNKIILIEPIGGMNFTPDPAKRGNQAPPYAIEVLGGYLKEKGKYDVSLIHQRPVSKKHINKELEGTKEGEKLINITDEDIVEMIAQKEGEEIAMVGLSAITPLFNRSLQIAKKIKERFSDIKIVIGGYHTSAMKDKVYLSKKYNEWEKNLKQELNNPSIKLVDFFTAGEGEQTILDIANAIKEGKTDFSEIKGIIYRNKNGEINEFKKRERFSNDELAEIPEAYRKILAPVKDEFEKIKEIKEIPSSVDCTQFGTFPGHKDIKGEIQIQSTRGCPGNCSFCSSPMVWGEEIETGQGKKYITPVKFRDSKTVVNEIKKYHDDPEYKTNFVYFSDLTFNENILHIQNLCREMVDSGIFGQGDKNKVSWFCLAKAFDVSNKEKEEKTKEILELMKRAGCSKIGIGIEGFTPNDIAELKRPTGQKDKDELYQEGIKKFTNIVWSLKEASKTGMFTRGYFVWGRENQDEFSGARAKALLELSIPKELFKNYDNLKDAVSFIFEKQDEFMREGENNRPFTSEEISKLVAEKFNLKESKKERFLEIDHLRLSPETPYPETALSKTAKLRHYDYVRGADGQLLRDDKGELVKKELNGEPMLIESEKTLMEMINEGWDDWEILSQECPSIESKMEIGEIEKLQKRITKEFYLSEGYTESSKRKLGKYPYLSEAYKSWADFLNEMKIPVEFDEWNESNREIKKEISREVKNEIKIR